MGLSSGLGEDQESLETGTLICFCHIPWRVSYISPPGGLFSLMSSTNG